MFFFFFFIFGCVTHSTMRLVCDLFLYYFCCILFVSATYTPFQLVNYIYFMFFFLQLLVSTTYTLVELTNDYFVFYIFFFWICWCLQCIYSGAVNIWFFFFLRNVTYTPRANYIRFFSRIFFYICKSLLLIPHCGLFIYYFFLFFRPLWPILQCNLYIFFCLISAFFGACNLYSAVTYSCKIWYV